MKIPHSALMGCTKLVLPGERAVLKMPKDPALAPVGLNSSFNFMALVCMQLQIDYQKA